MDDTEIILCFVLVLFVILLMIYFSGYYACYNEFHSLLDAGYKPAAKPHGKIIWRGPDD